MSEATPPPPAEPTGQPRQQGPRYSGGGTNSLAAMNVYDLAIIACGVLAFIGSLLPFYTVHFLGASGSETAWHGFWGWFACLIALAAAVLLVLPYLGVRLTIPLRLVTLVMFVIALICDIIAGLTWPGAPAGSGDATGHGFGYWLSLIVIIVGTALAFLRKDATD